MVEDVVEHAGQVIAEHAVAHLESEDLHERGVVFFELGDGEPAGVLRGVTLGVGAFHEPGAGPPGSLGGMADGAERGEFRFALSTAEFFSELGITAGFAADGADIATDITGGASEPATIGEEGADFGAFGFVEGARAADGRGIGSGECGVWRRHRGGPVDFWLATKSTIKRKNCGREFSR